MVADVLTLTTLVKVVVDIVQLAWPNRPAWIPPALALASAVLLAALGLNAAGAWDILSTAILAAGAAVGVTELQDARRRMQYRR